MTVSICIASRGRSELLVKCVQDTLAKAECVDTRIVVALDSDDPWDAAEQLPEGVVVSVAEREDSLGAKYNRCAAMHPASVYVLWSDDVKFVDKGWDTKLNQAEQSLPDSLGVIYFGSLPNVFQPGIAVTHRFMDAMGFFCTPYFPYWWHDTWIDEIGNLSGRIVHSDIKVAILQDLKGKSRGVRDVEFWAKFFDETRHMRVEVAEKILAESVDYEWRKEQLKHQMPNVIKFLEHRNSLLRDPLQAKRVEAHFSFDAPADERYLRIKAKAVEILSELGS